MICSDLHVLYNVFRRSAGFDHKDLKAFATQPANLTKIQSVGSMAAAARAAKIAAAGAAVAAACSSSLQQQEEQQQAVSK